MKPVAHLVGCCLALTAACTGQTVRPAFEVASIRPSLRPAEVGLAGQMIRSPGRVSYSYVSVQNLLAQAYRIKNFQIAGPGWLDSDRFDIEAKLPTGATDDQLPAMLQSLLEDRFMLAFHRESRNMTAYVLLPAKGGPKLKVVDDTQPSDVQTTAGPLRRHISGKIGMTYLAGLLSNLLDRPVVDMTKIQGRYDVDLEWSPDAESGSQLTDVPSLFAALQEKLGLRLETRRTPVDVYVIDHMDRVPAEN
jgi:uncharacterized protein (TIGR03435 family)